MSIEIVLRETEDDFQVSSVESVELGVNPQVLMNTLSNIMFSGGTNQQILYRIAGHINDHYPWSSWAIRVERTGGYVYCLRFDRLTVMEDNPSTPEPEVVRRSRYLRDPVI